MWGSWWRNRYILWQKAKLAGDPTFPYEWYERNLFAPRTGEEYKQLFPKVAGKITGDLTPNYALMNSAQLAEIAKASPQTKIIYLLRNPIERSWSEFRFEEKGKWVNSGLSIDAIFDVIVNRAESFKNHGHYASKILHWNNYFPNNVHVYFFDDLVENPGKLFKKICKTLKISSNVPLIRFITKRINAAPACDMPILIREWLSNLLREEMAAMNDLYPNHYPQEWLTGKKHPKNVSRY